MTQLLLRDYVIHSRKTGAMFSLKAHSREEALLTASELLAEPLKNLVTYQLNDW